MEMRFVKAEEPFYIRKSAHIILGVGLLFFAGAGFIYASQYFFMKEANTSTGRVIGFDVPKGKVLKRPIIEYYTKDHHKYKYYHSEGTNPPRYRLGEEVKVYYDPLNPEDVSLGHSFIPIIILSIFGLVFSSVGMTIKNNCQLLL